MVFDKVVEYCKKNNMSISAFEQLCGIGNGVVARWEDEASSPSLQTLKKMEKHTGIKIAKWISG